VSNYDANRQRAFADVVSIDAWHDKFSPSKTKVNLYADVVFGTGRLGGEIDCLDAANLDDKFTKIILARVFATNGPVG